MQRYNWTGTLNTRDLGGTPTTNGEYVKYQKFIRSDAPNKISNDIRDFLVDRDIKTIIDLRNENIVKRAPNAFFQDDRFERYNFPLSINAKVPNSEGDFIENYYCMLENEIAIANIFKTMANSKSGVLFYCQEGKDRTGLIAAIILLLAEVADIDIFADYEISNVYLYEMVKIAKTIPNGIPDFLLYVKPEYMETILSYLRGKYETVENYLLAKGISSTEISNLKRKLLV
jgi:protein-tyrosine phosphatase